MRRTILILLVLATSGGLAWLNANYEIKKESGQIILRSKKPQTGSGSSGMDPTLTDATEQPDIRKDRHRIRIATFNPGNLNSRRLASPIVKNQLARLLQDYDIIALQDIQENSTGPLVDLLRQMNAHGRHYEYAVSPEVLTGNTSQYNAFLFDSSSVEIDHDRIYTIHDPGNRLLCRPLSALFRVRGPAPLEAFTFVLINARVTSPQHALSEVDLLADVVATTKKILPDEDDFILAGSLETDPTNYGRLGLIPNFEPVVTDQLTSTIYSQNRDNILVDRLATVEYLGKANVANPCQRLNLSIQDAQALLAHMPVWAEFSLYEGESTARAILR